MGTHLPIFTGNDGPEEYMVWERLIEYHFELYKYKEKKKVSIASYQFYDYADDWWYYLKKDRRRHGKKPIATWEKLRYYLRKHFVPSSYVKYKEIQNFRQELERLKALCLDLQRQLVPTHDFTTYGDYLWKLSDDEVVQVEPHVESPKEEEIVVIGSEESYVFDNHVHDDNSFIPSPDFVVSSNLCDEHSSSQDFDVEINKADVEEVVPVEDVIDEHYSSHVAEFEIEKDEIVRVADHVRGYVAEKKSIDRDLHVDFIFGDREFLHEADLLSLDFMKLLDPFRKKKVLISWTSYAEIVFLYIAKIRGRIFSKREGMIRISMWHSHIMSLLFSLGQSSLKTIEKKRSKCYFEDCMD